MKPKQTKKTHKPTGFVDIAGSVYSSIGQAAKGMGVPQSTLKAAKRMGAPGFRGSRVDASLLEPWLAEHRNDPELVAASRYEIARADEAEERVRARRMANDVEESKYVPRSWVIAAIGKASGELNSIRAKSESEDPIRLAAAGVDVPANRAELKRVWDGIVSSIQTLSRHFAEAKPQ